MSARKQTAPKRAPRKRLPQIRPGGEARPPAPRREPLSPSHAAARLDAEVDARLVALCERMSTSWHQANRSEVLRAVILAGLPIIEAAYPPK